MKAESAKRTNGVVSESRKIRKPLMEKKRRARINDSLETLKQILLESKTTIKDSSRKSGGQRTAKLEKADILEMTVRYLQHLRDKINHISSTNTLVKPPSDRIKEETRISPADSSCDVKYGVALVPARLPNGTIAFVVPPTSVDGKFSQSCPLGRVDDLESEQNVWRPW